MSGMSGTYEIMALVTTTPSTTEVRRISRRAAAVAPSATLAVDAKAKALQAAGEHVIGFGAGEPDFPTPAHIVEAAVLACRDPANHRYTPTGGIPALREAIADKTERDSGLVGERRTGAGDQRREAGGGQRLRCALRPRRRGPRARALLDHLPRGDRGWRAGPRSSSPPTRRPASAPRSRTSRRPGRPTPRRCSSCRPPTRRGPCTHARRSRRSAAGRWPRASGCSPTRSTSTWSTAGPSTTPCRCSCPSWPTAAWWPTAWPRPTP